MVLLGLREGSFDRLFPPSINTLATMRFRKGIDPSPATPATHAAPPPSVHTRPETFCSSRTPLAGLAFTAVLPGTPRASWSSRSDVVSPGRCIRRDPGRSGSGTSRSAALCACAAGTRSPLVSLSSPAECAIHALWYPASSPHVFGQRAQPCFDLVEYFGHRCHVVDVAASTCTFTITLRLLSTVRCSL